MTVSKTTNSNHELTINILKVVILTAIGVVDEDGKPNGQSDGILVNDFKGNLKKTVEEYMNEFLKVFFLSWEEALLLQFSHWTNF